MKKIVLISIAVMGICAACLWGCLTMLRGMEPKDDDCTGHASKVYHYELDGSFNSVCEDVRQDAQRLSGEERNGDHGFFSFGNPDNGCIGATVEVNDATQGKVHVKVSLVDAAELPAFTFLHGKKPVRVEQPTR